MTQEQLFLETFAGRKDCVGNVVYGKAKKTTISGTEEELYEKIRDHLNGKHRLGFYNKLIDLTAPWAIVEFEDHGPGKVPDPWGYSLKLKELLRDAGMEVYIERSKNEGGNSYHNWIFFEKSLNAGYVHDVLTGLLKLIDANVSPEVFPKSGEDNLGNFVWMPLFGGQDELGLGIKEERTVFVDESGTKISDQWAVLKGIQRISNDKFDRLVSHYKIVLPSDNDSEVSTQFNQPGLNRILENCPFINYCEENAETLGEPLWYAMISNLCLFAGGREKIHELSKPYPNYSRNETDAKIDHALSVYRANPELGPTTYGKIIKAGWPGKKPLWPESPAGWGYHLDVQGKIEEFNRIKDKHIRDRKVEQFLNNTVARLSPIRQDSIIKEINKGCNISVDSIRKTLDKAPAKHDFDYDQPLKKILPGIESSVEKGRIAFEWFQRKGGRFYKDRENHCCLYYKDEIYRIDSNRPFKSLMFITANISENNPGGKVIFDAIANMAFEKGNRMDYCSWQYTDLVSNEIYIDLNNDEKELLKITPGEIEVVKNGNNSKSIILQGSNKIKPIQYRELHDSERRLAFARLKDHAFNNLACPPADRYLYLSWALAFPLIEYFKTVPHMRGEGSSTCGKSRSMDVIGHLIYGDTVLKKGTTAANYTDGALNPLIQMDNIETKNLSDGLEDFIITAVTGIEKEKRRLGTDRENVIERVKTLINTTGIEGLNKPEMINRTFVVNFDHSKYGNPEWNELIYVDIVKHRNLMLSAIFQMISGVLKRIADGELNTIVKELSEKYPNHSKSRANSYLACMIMIAEKLIEGFGDSITVDELVEQWIDTQNETARENSRGTNPIIQLLDSLVKDHDMEFQKSEAYGTEAKFINPYPVEIADLGSRWTIVGTAGELHTAFSILAKRTGGKNPFSNAHQLASRLKDSEKILRDNCWTFKTDEAGSRRRIYKLSRCESVKVPNGVSQGLSQ